MDCQQPQTVSWFRVSDLPMVQSLSHVLEDVIALLRQRNTCSLCSPVEDSRA